MHCKFLTLRGWFPWSLIQTGVELKLCVGDMLCSQVLLPQTFC